MNNQNSYFKTNIANMIQDVMSSNRTSKFSSFLTELEQSQAQEILNHYRFDNYMFFGGSDDCDRVILGVFDDYIIPEYDQFPICGIKITPTDKNSISLTHRDYLGSIMGLQLKRDVIGDIFCFDNYGVVFLKENLQEFVFTNLDKVSKTRVKLSLIDGKEIKNTKKFVEMKGTISSLRLDCVVAFLIAKSRTNSTNIITAGMVTVNSCVITNVSKMLKSGDVIVVRSKGKFILGDEIKHTKKDRLFITINKLI